MSLSERDPLDHNWMLIEQAAADALGWKRAVVDDVSAGLCSDYMGSQWSLARKAAMFGFQAAREEAYKEGAGEPAKGWLYHCPDTGTEWSDNHPIESGEVPDAKDVRPSTLDALHAELMAAWEVLAERPSPPDPQARIEALEGALKALEVTAKALRSPYASPWDHGKANGLMEAVEKIEAALNQGADHDRA